jgi:hypothetical protein
VEFTTTGGVTQFPVGEYVYKGTAAMGTYPFKYSKGGTEYGNGTLTKTDTKRKLNDKARRGVDTRERRVEVLSFEAAPRPRPYRYEQKGHSIPGHGRESSGPVSSRG